MTVSWVRISSNCLSVFSFKVFLQDNQNTEGMNLLKNALKRPDLLKPISDLFVPSVTVPEVFLELYKFIVESHLKNCDPKVLFVLLSKVRNDDIRNFLFPIFHFCTFHSSMWALGWRNKNRSWPISIHSCIWYCKDSNVGIKMNQRSFRV